MLVRPSLLLRLATGPRARVLARMPAIAQQFMYDDWLRLLFIAIGDLLWMTAAFEKSCAYFIVCLP